eukprot:scaffold1265_cov38-Cyclotella_meneghiniana.AAC.7
MSPGHLCAASAVMVTAMASELSRPTPTKSRRDSRWCWWGVAMIRRLIGGCRPWSVWWRPRGRWLFLCVGVIPVVWASRHAHGPTKGGSHVRRNSDMGLFSENVEKCHVIMTCHDMSYDRKGTASHLDFRSTEAGGAGSRYYLAKYSDTGFLLQQMPCTVNLFRRFRGDCRRPGVSPGGSDTRSQHRFEFHESVGPPGDTEGADNHYISEEDRQKLGLPILKKSSRYGIRVGVANGGTSKGVNVTQQPFEKLSAKAVKADTFNDFPDSLISVGQLADDETVSIFLKEGVSVHKEEDVLITVKNEPLLIGVRDEQGRYRIPLQQHKGQWKPRHASKKARQTLRKANSVYDLPSTEQAIKWMHAVCGYPVKTTWLKAIKAGNYVGWPLLTVKNVTKYHPETTETPKGHLNQTRKNVRSTKPKPFETANTA